MKTTDEHKLVLGIVGSARKNGNSAFLLQETLRHLKDDCETETIFLSDQNIHPCDGCHWCESSGSCRIDDDMPALSTKLRRADAIILASPSYMGGVSSRMQAFMERTWPLRKGQMNGKIGSSIITGRRRIGVAPGALQAYFTRLGMLKVPGVVGYAFGAGEIAEDREARGQAERLAQDLQRVLTMMRQ
jgi:multimeric flavodoxin WrbA